MRHLIASIVVLGVVWWLVHQAAPPPHWDQSPRRSPDCRACMTSVSVRDALYISSHRMHAASH